MSSHPLTHHEIFTLVEPFTRRARHVDLAASDRLERCLLFKPRDHGEDASELRGVREILLLENPKPDMFRLTRTLRHPDGLEADLVVEGREPGDLLDRVESIDPRRHFREKGGYRIARSYRLESSAGGAVDAAAATRLLLTRGAAHVDGLTLTMKAQTGRGMPAELELHAEDGDTIVLPEDMLAVIGWDWRRLNRVKSCWKSTLRLRGKEPDRSRDGEVKLTRTVEHLAETLGEPPARYHERLVAARWNVAFRRALPLLIGLGLIFGAPAIQFLELSEGSLIRMLIFHSPPLLMVLFFSMKEMPRIEIPPFPKPLTTPSWREGPPDPPGESTKASTQEV
ncbi:hypothetical protein [Thiocapsa bogorovii]|uniref:hypothetical protein n=1 Tax=Thiocapsa bogorovii TaxID=521689 RepID=UPI001E3E1A3A|nr:hypothetical protein [Thiocapsa bogorovii]UHD15367.1 hypothetical protein LT988_19170 [Thiocapsa bogorovii]